MWIEDAKDGLFFAYQGMVSQFGWKTRLERQIILPDHVDSIPACIKKAGFN
jgi:hypothetical protein